MEIFSLIKQNDPENQFNVLKNSYSQIEYAQNNQVNLSAIDTNKIKNIILCGLGGSAIGGDLLQNFLRDELSYPFQVIRNYYLPAYADENTLLIASSYSGNTEETISCVNAGLKRNCQIITITTGGKLEELSQKYNLPIAKLLPGFQPRYALWINFFTLLKTLQSLKLIPVQNEITKQVIELLKKRGDEFSTFPNSSLEFAEKLVGFIPVIYSVSDLTSAVGSRLKAQINENSKLHAFCNFFPEQNHNEIIGWETFSEKQFNSVVINILDVDYHPQIKKRFEIVTELIRRSGVEVLSIESNLPDYKLRLMDNIYFSDWVSYYLAVIRNQNPTEIKNINYLKEHL
ncbi:bifunctional phosphoglucose/phosphomannose isomerase [Melioribacteraceae bacterium 4301-Me]|uniref:bifunctional phosphoglucose/phosphomannose isomerase n=1 Tax=Pyranulibacter aquaticus TaxID=3163344 RepID=UPI00359892BB